VGASRTSATKERVVERAMASGGAPESAAGGGRLEQRAPEQVER
jgi:hypothetical protein